MGISVDWKNLKEWKKIGIKKNRKNWKGKDKMGLNCKMTALGKE